MKITEGNPAWDLKFFKELCKFLYERECVQDLWCLCILLFAFNLCLANLWENFGKHSQNPKPLLAYANRIDWS